MKRLKDLNIGTKIVFSFAAVIALVAVMMIVTQFSMNSIGNDMETFYTQEFRIVDVSQTVMTDLQGYAKGLSRVALAAKNVENRKTAAAETYQATRTKEMNSYLDAMLSTDWLIQMGRKGKSTNGN